MATHVKYVHFHPLESGKTCISAHSTVKKRQNTSKTCIFTLWRVGKRACSPRTSRMHRGTAYMQNTSKTCIFTLWRVGKRACSPRTTSEERRTAKERKNRNTRN